MCDSSNSASRWFTMRLWWSLLQCNLSSWSMARSIRGNVYSESPNLYPSNHRRWSHRMSPSFSLFPTASLLIIQILLILFFLLRCLLRCCGLCGGRNRPPKPKRSHRNRPIPPAPPIRQSGQGGYMNNPPPPSAFNDNNRHSNSLGSQEPINRPYAPEQSYQNYGQPNHGPGGGGGWVDESHYNGPYYGRQEAYGR
jgi:hypothetical protein